jgi:prophage maintenance system killer protein
MYTLKLTQIGNSVGVVLPREALALNGWRLPCTQAEATFTMLAVASGDVSEDAFAGWLRVHTARRT